MNWTTTISSSLQEGIIVPKFLRMGKDDVRECKQVSPYGFDSNPIKGAAAAYSETGVIGDDVILGYISKESVTESGESRVFSTDDEGVLKIYIHLKKNGDIHFGGDDDNLIRYGQTANSINELKGSINDLKNIISSWVPVPNDGGAALKAALTAWLSDPIIEDISGAKIDEFKTL